MSSTIQIGILLRRNIGRVCFPIIIRSCSTYRREMVYKGLNKALQSPMRSTIDPKCRVHPQVNESKYHIYTMNTTLTQELQRLKYSKRVTNLMNNINNDTYLNQKLITREISSKLKMNFIPPRYKPQREHRQAGTSSKLFSHSLSHYFYL